MNELIAYAKEYSLAVNPKYTIGGWAELVLTLGRCPCDPQRETCPCSQGHLEVEQNGRCLCNFFVKRNA